MLLLDAFLGLTAGSVCVGCGVPGRLLCRACEASLPVRAGVARPHPTPEGLAEASAAAPYDAVVRELVVAHKERRAFALARPLGDLLAVAVHRVVARPSLVDAAIVLVPVPSRPAVVAARGHDPMLRVCRRAQTRLRATGHGVRVVRLLRQADRPLDQAGLSGAERRTNVVHTMAARGSAMRALAAERTPVLAVVCDDVMTTGSTAREAQRALEAVGVGVAGIACVASTDRRMTPSPAIV